MLGPQHLSHEVERRPGEQKISFYVEGLTFPDADFLGLVSLSISLVDTGVCTVLGAERAAQAGGWGALKPDGAPCRAHLVLISPPDPARGAPLHRHRGLPHGPLDHDPQHPAPPGAVCVQVRSHPSCSFPFVFGLVEIGKECCV